MYSTHFSCQNLMKIELCQQIFEKYSNTKFDEKLSSRSRVAPCDRPNGQKDRYDEANNRLSQICERA